MQIRQRYKEILAYFESNQPHAQTELNYMDVYQLTVAVILSAQCTDKRVNLITPAFYERFPDFSTLANAEIEDVFDCIRSCSYPNNKAKNLKAMASMVMEVYKGEMPSDIDELQKLPGVGRKTANVIASVYFNKPAIAVDTHVARVSQRLGLVDITKDPLKIEMQLMKYIPKEKLSIAHHWLILHGRYICIARKPDCLNCSLKQWCNYYASNVKE